MLKRKNKIITFLSCILLVLMIFGSLTIIKKNYFKTNSNSVSNLEYKISGSAFVKPIKSYLYKTEDMENTKKMAYLKIGGKLVYCLQPKEHIGTGLNYTCDYQSSYSKEQIANMELITAYGYNYPGHNSDEYYMAAQELIWEELGHTTEYFDGSINNPIDVDDEKNEIRRLISNNDKSPDFGSQPIKMKIGEKITLIDKNNVLSEYTVVDAKPNKATIKENALTVTISNSSPKEISIRLVKKAADIDRPSAICFAGKFQEVLYPGTSAGSFTLKIIVEGGTDLPDTCKEDSNPHRKTTCGNPTTFNDEKCSVKRERLYYNISCSEMLIFNNNGQNSPSITSGEGFEYGADIYGIRKCNGTFKADKWRTDYNNYSNTAERAHNDAKRANDRIDNLWEQLNNAKTPTQMRSIEQSIERAERQKDAAVDRRDRATDNLARLDRIKEAFDSWTNNYRFKPSVKIDIQEGTKTKPIKFVQQIIEEVNNHSRDFSSDLRPYKIKNCTFPEWDNAECYYSSIDIYANWERNSYVDATYKLPKKYIEKDSNATIKNSKNGCPTCIDGGNKYYTDFDTPTGEYNIKVTASNLGHKRKWSVTDECSYKLKNLVKPTEKDENYDASGTFLYRPISLFDPFPNRKAGPNWLGKENLITDNASTLYNEIPEYVVDLTPHDIQQIKKSNALMKNKNISNVYTEYKNNSKDADPKKPYKSYFIHTEFKNLFGGSAK